MNETYMEEYINSQGQVYQRTKFQSIKMKIFAATKRIFDVGLALIGLIVLSPLFLIIAIAIKLDSQGPVFFRQQRTGKDGKLFTLYKFRSMEIDNDVHDFTKKDMHTRVGKVLRKTSLDELPQLICILQTKMSFIGPRPWIPDYYENMNEVQRHRCDVRPGITGLAQVKGRNDIDIFKKIDYDLKYIQNYSFVQDIKIIFLTIKAVFTRKGVDAGKGTISNELNDLKTQETMINVRIAKEV